MVEHSSRILASEENLTTTTYSQLPISLLQDKEKSHLMAVTYLRSYLSPHKLSSLTTMWCRCVGWWKYMVAAGGRFHRSNEDAIYRLHFTAAEHLSSSERAALLILRVLLVTELFFYCVTML